MASEHEIIGVLREADNLNLLFSFQAESAAYHPYVNTAIQILDYLDEQEAGKTINEIARDCDMSYNTAAIFLRCLEKLGKVEFDKSNPGARGSVPKTYFLTGKEL